MRQRAGKEGQGPAVFVGQGAEGRHRRPLDTLRDHLVQGHQTARRGALAVGEGNRTRVQIRGQRPVAGARGAVARSALLRIQRRAAREIGHGLGRYGYRVGGNHQRIGRMRQPRHFGRRGLAFDRNAQCLNGGRNAVPRGMGRQLLDLFGGIRGEVQHLRIFALADHGAVGDRPAVIDGHVVQQLPQLARIRRRRSRLGMHCPGPHEQAQNQEQNFSHDAILATTVATAGRPKTAHSPTVARSDTFVRKRESMPKLAWPCRRRWL